MNKKLLAIAVGAAMVAGATAATAGDEPTWYGKIHLSIDSMDNGGDTSANEGDGVFVSSNSSRLGIKGKVDLDGGLKAVYKYEIFTDYTKESLRGNRNAYLGLNSGGHTVIAGRHDMPFKTVGRKFDLFGDTIGDMRALTRKPGGVDDWAMRRDNIIMYTGKFDAVSVKVAYGSPEGVDDSTDTSVGITYKGGPIKVMFASEQHGFASTNSTGNTIAGSYKMGNMKFLAGYQAISDSGGDETDNGTSTGWMLGFAMKAAKNTFKIQYTSGETDVTDSASTLVALGVDHAFSKKTKVYAVYAAITNDDFGGAGFTNSGHDGTVAAVTGEDASGFSVGMVHKF